MGDRLAPSATRSGADLERKPGLATMAGMNTKPKRRWFRFSLRSLLVLIAVLAVPIVWLGKEWRQSKHEQEVAEQLRKLGFSVELKGPYDSGFWPGGPPQPGWRNIARQVIGERIVFLQS